MSFILFHSDHCQYCRQLLDTVKRMDGQGRIRLFNVDKHARPAQLQGVPALMVLPAKNIIYGKQVFDYLLLPNRGILVTGSGAANATQAQGQAQGQAMQAQEPAPFAALKAQTSSSFAMWDNDTNTPLADQPVSWEWMNSGSGSGTGTGVAPPIANNTQPLSPPGLNVETRDRLGKTIDFDGLLAQRESDLRSFTGA